MDTMLGSKRRRIDVFANGSTLSKYIRLPDLCDKAELARLAANKLGRAVPGAPESVRFFLEKIVRGKKHTCCRAAPLTLPRSAD